VTVNTTGLAPGVYHATLFIQTNSGRVPTLRVAVKLTVPAYYQAVNAGDNAYTDHDGDSWSADRLYSAGSWGYTSSSSHVASTRRGISGTEDDPLYQSQRQDPLEYRFDGLPAGTYEVDLRFAEVSNRQPNTRLFDVIVENSLGNLSFLHRKAFRRRRVSVELRDADGRFGDVRADSISQGGSGRGFQGRNGGRARTRAGPVAKARRPGDRDGAHVRARRPGRHRVLGSTPISPATTKDGKRPIR
jgi:hypothetical protein